jgi:hypothetical protein
MRPRARLEVHGIERRCDFASTRRALGLGLGESESRLFFFSEELPLVTNAPATSGVIGRSERYVLDDDRCGIALFVRRFDGFSDVIGMVASTHLARRFAEIAPLEATIDPNPSQIEGEDEAPVARVAAGAFAMVDEMGGGWDPAPRR